MKDSEVRKAYEMAKERYAAYGVDTEAAMETLQGVPISLQCWQGDDVGGFERPDGQAPGGGLQVTGQAPGKARNVQELRLDLDKALSLIPSKHRVNLHAMYGEFGGKAVDRDAIDIDHFLGWVQWAQERQMGLDFNATCFSHSLAADGYTLSHADPGIRDFWIDHVARCREIAARIGLALHQRCIHNLWIPDGSKDNPANRCEMRRRLVESLDRVYEEKYPAEQMRDSVESKLFGIGSEAYVVGSHDFYLGYAFTRGLMICLDMGHYHPTESVADKITSLLPFMEEILVHVSRGIRWDSDHVVIVSDELRAVAQDVARAEQFHTVHFALDYFDAEMNRVGAWVIGTRATQKAILEALLEPSEILREYQYQGRFFERLALMEEAKSLPHGAVWDYFCTKNDVPIGQDWVDAIRQYEAAVQSART